MRALLWRWMGFGDVVIRVYHAYAYGSAVHVRGRVLREDFVKAKPNDRWFRNLINMIRRLMSYELPSVQLEINYNSALKTVMLDREGFFNAKLSNKEGVSDTIILTIKQKNLDRFHKKDVSQKAIVSPIGRALQLALVSDIDDTLLRTGVTSFFKWRLIINTLFRNPLRRRTFEGAPLLYNELSNSGHIPVFYISNSPWNMHDYLSDYLTAKGYPTGILLLRDININEFKDRNVREQNKYKEIAELYHNLKELEFILIGDAGEYDVDIYLQLADEFPNRTRAIYIRSVESDKRNERVKRLIEENTVETPILLFEESHEVQTHARSMGLMPK